MHFTGKPFAIEPEREIQTHANLVLLKGDRAYKFKKPVKFPFLDYSTLELRREMIANELGLNRRFAPDWYLGVCEIIEAHGELEIGDIFSEMPELREGVIDYAVAMKRVPDDAWLPHVMRDGELTEARIEALMRKALSTLVSAEPTDDVNANGRPENLRHNTVANVAECEPFVPECLSRESWQRLDKLLRGWFEENHDVFNRRVDERRIRDGHGDLKPGNIAFVNDEPVITDCIEFNPLFRRLDILAEVAFLATGLESLGAFAAAARVFGSYREIGKDDYPEKLRRYYQAHLACVMGKVTALQLNEPGIAAEQKQRARALAAHYFALADFHAREPHVVVVMGIMGCGKSTVANSLSRHFGWPVVSSDIERKRLAGVAPNERLPDSAYTDETAENVYRALFDAARSAKTGIILDAQFPTAEFRQRANEAAGGGAVFVHCDAPDEVVRRRMRQRELDPSRTSDATADLLATARSRFELPSESEAVVSFDTSDDASAIKLVESKLIGGNYNPELARQ